MRAKNRAWGWGVLLFLAVQVVLLLSSQAASAAHPVAAAPLAQATATPTATSTPTSTPTATPTLPAARIYSDPSTGEVWHEQSFPRAGMNCIVQVVGQAAGNFSCVAGTPVP